MPFTVKSFMPHLFAKEKIVTFTARIISRLFNANLTFSQEGEDRILMRLFESTSSLNSPGFYIDIGANHPRRFSNSYLFYLKGWKGICIEPNPELASLFRQIRPRDTIVNCGVSSKEDKLDLILFNDDALNTFDEELASWREKNTPYKILGKQSVSVLPLANILKDHVLPAKINFMNIDVEGLDLEVLKSNDWSKLRPDYILVENLEQKNNPIEEYLTSLDYTLISKTKNTSIYNLLH